MIRILYILTKDDIGGAQKYIHDLVAHLDAKQFSSQVLYGGRDLRWLTNKVYPWFLFINDWMAIIELFTTYRRIRPDIIHLNSSKAGVLGSLAGWLYKISLALYPTPQTLNPKVIFTAHGWVFQPDNKLSALTRMGYRLLHTIAGYFQNTIICVSAYDRTLALQLHIAPARKLVTIHNGIDYTNIPFLDKVSARKEITQKLDPTPHTLNPSSLWIGSIGRLTKEKDYATLIETARLVPDAYFFIIGEGSEKNNLQQMTNNLQLTERLFFIPPTGEDALYLKAFDIFALSSIKEGLPYALLEAMGARIPIVATNAGGVPEIIQDRISGFVVEKNNPTVFSATLKKLIADATLRKKLGVEARHTIQAQFSLEKMISETARVYDAL